MSHSVVFVFLVVVAGFSAINSQRPKPCERGIRRGGWGSTCFGTQYTLKDSKVDRCDSINYNTTQTGCPTNDDGDEEACCVDCHRQDNICNRRYRGSVAQNTPCCPGFLEVMTARPDSGCVCCKNCRPKSWCRSHTDRHRCITKNDPVYNPEWCLNDPSHINGRIFKRQCHGNGCWCCLWDLE